MHRIVDRFLSLTGQENEGDAHLNEEELYEVKSGTKAANIVYEIRKKKVEKVL